MDAKIKIGKAVSYMTTDGKVFAGKGSKSMAEKHQWSLDKKVFSNKFDVFMRKIFGIKHKYNPEDYSDEELGFCNDMMKYVEINADDGDFKDDVSGFILDLFGFIGPERWQQIHDFLTKKK